MDRFPIELLFYAALFAVILLFNYAARRAASQRREPQPQQETPEYWNDEAPPPQQPYAREESGSEFWGVRPTAVVTPLTPAAVDRAEHPRPAGTAPLRRKRYTRRSLLGSKRDLRRAIVLMAVLGPCRGTESPERPRSV
jgi:hypothetical protein